MSHAETLTHQLPVRFSAVELALAARWIAARSGPVASLLRIENTLVAMQAILGRVRVIVCLRGLMPASGLEALYIPSAGPHGGVAGTLTGDLDPMVMTAIGRALRAEFLVSGQDVVRIESDDGSLLIVYAIEVRAVVLAATGVTLIDM